MSETKPNEPSTEAKAQLPNIEDATDTIKGLLDNLIPPESIEITDIFGTTHSLRSTTSARAQVKIVRMLEDIKDVTLPVGFQYGGITPSEIIKILGSLITNDQVFETVCKAVEYAHPQLVKKLVTAAQDNDIEYDPELPVADLLPIEEAIASVVPLLLSIARRTGEAISKVAAATNQ